MRHAVVPFDMVEIDGMGDRGNLLTVKGMPTDRHGFRQAAGPLRALDRSGIMGRSDRGVVPDVV